jgi:hypothetical protein
MEGHVAITTGVRQIIVHGIGLPPNTKDTTTAIVKKDRLRSNAKRQEPILF